MKITPQIYGMDRTKGMLHPTTNAMITVQIEAIIIPVVLELSSLSSSSLPLSQKRQFWCFPFGDICPKTYHFDRNLRNFEEELGKSGEKFQNLGEISWNIYPFDFFQ